MRKPLFSGACTALVTPFLNGKVNYPMMEQLLRRQIEAGIKAVVIAGTTGESPTLSDEEKVALFHRCKSYADDKCLIIAGTGSNSTEHAVELSIAAEEAGADALLVVTPYYNKATPDGLYAHFLSIAHAVSIPIILYNVPTRTGVDIPVSVYQRLSRVPNIIGVKEASSDLSLLEALVAECGDDLDVWTGNDAQAVAAMRLGAAGVISVASNVLPHAMVELCRLCINEHYRAAEERLLTLREQIDALFAEINPIPVKYVAALKGLCAAEYRLPLCPPSPELARRLQGLFYP